MKRYTLILIACAALIQSSIAEELEIPDKARLTALATEAVTNRFSTFDASELILKSIVYGFEPDSTLIREYFCVTFRVNNTAFIQKTAHARITTEDEIDVVIMPDGTIPPDFINLQTRSLTEPLTGEAKSESIRSRNRTSQEMLLDLKPNQALEGTAPRGRLADPHR